MRAARKNQSGTTLLEVAATLAIMGILAAGATAIIFNTVEGSLSARNQSASAENIQGAITRITHEIANLDIKRSYTFGASSIAYYYRSDANQSTIQLSGSTITLNGNVLLTNVTGFQVTAPNYITSPAVAPQVRITVNVPRADGTTVSRVFTAKISLNTQRWQ